MRLWSWILLLTTSIASAAYLWLVPLPLGIPGEWTWQRIAAEPDLPWNLVGVTIAAALYVAFVHAGARQLQHSTSPIKLTGWLIGLVVMGFAWLWTIQESAPIINRMGKSAFVLYYASSSGYFTRTRYEDPNAREFLGNYEELMREGDVLHVGTHPPGLFLIFHALINACQQAPWLQLLDATQPASFREACDVIARNSLRSEPPRPFLPTDRRVLWMATLLVMSSASLTVLPLFALLRRCVDSVSAWRGAALWPAIPAVAIFVPKSDVAYAFVGALILASWLAAIERKSLLFGMMTGLLTWCGLMMSLAFLPVVLLTAIVGWNSGSLLGKSAPEAALKANSWKTSLPPIGCLLAAIAGFAMPIGVMGWLYGINMVTIWRLNYLNHASFYAKYSRTYWMWLLENPLELAFAAGWPVFVLAILAVMTTLRTRWQPQLRFVSGILIVWGALWVTGKNSGEAARLWIIFLPWLVWLAGLKLAEFENDGPRWRSPGNVLLAMQLVVCALTVIRISGFEQ